MFHCDDYSISFHSIVNKDVILPGNEGIILGILYVKNGTSGLEVICEDLDSLRKRGVVRVVVKLLGEIQDR
jgi:hypothetical protein